MKIRAGEEEGKAGRLRSSAWLRTFWGCSAGLLGPSLTECAAPTVLSLFSSILSLRPFPLASCSTKVSASAAQLPTLRQICCEGGTRLRE